MGDASLLQDQGPLEYRQARAELNALIAESLRRPDERPGVSSAAQLERAIEAVRDLTPNEPTLWWPGGWLGRPIDGYLLQRMVMDRPVRCTELEAIEDRPIGLAPEEWATEWIPTLPANLHRPDEFRVWDDLLDAQSWRDMMEGGRVRTIPGTRPTEIAGHVMWVLTAAASGMIGNAAYDAAKNAVTKFRQRQSRHERDTTQSAKASSAHDSADGDSASTGRRPVRALHPLDIDIPEGIPPVLGLDTSETPNTAVRRNTLAGTDSSES
ncbi:hypothetical protein [Actinocrispum wychmicini]|nr:hypothetical protein [Actinocrispum wychmicini]